VSSSIYKLVDCPELENERVVCLTLDVEQDYGDLLEKPAYEGLEYIQEFVDFFKGTGIPLTCFVQGSLFETHPDKIEALLHLDAEIELHSYSHPSPEKRDVRFEVERGKKAYHDFLGRPPAGYRSPLGVIGRQDYEILTENGFQFDSSVFPSLRPGVFNNLILPTRPYILNGCNLVEFPLTVLSSFIRIPLALSYIRLVGRPYLHVLRLFPLPNLIIFNLHLHDLFQLSSSSKLPLEEVSSYYRWIFHKIYMNNDDGLIWLGEIIEILQEKGYMFSKLTDIYRTISDLK